MQRQKKVTFKRYINRKRIMRTYPKKRLSGQDTTNVKCELYDTMIVSNGDNAFKFNGSATDNHSVQDMLQNSTSFQDMQSRYARYKINGVACKASRMISDTTIAASFTSGCIAPCCIAFYPQLVGSSVGTAVLANDKKFIIYGHDGTPQSHYWKFPNQYFEASAGGYGTWNNMSNYTSLSGEFAAFNADNSANNTSGSAKAVYTVCFTFYITFSSKNS